MFKSVQPWSRDEEPVPVDDPAEQRRTIAEKMLARGFESPLGGAGPRTAEETAEAFGREMFRLHGKNWSAMIGLATGAAMKAERESMEVRE